MNFELLKARKELDLTQQEIADKAGTTRGRYNRIELEQTKATIEEAYKIADAVNKKVDEIFLIKDANKISKVV